MKIRIIIPRIHGRWPCGWPSLEHAPAARTQTFSLRLYLRVNFPATFSRDSNGKSDWHARSIERKEGLLPRPIPIRDPGPAQGDGRGAGGDDCERSAQVDRIPRPFGTDKR